MEAERQRQAAEQAKVADAAPGTVTGAQAPAAAPGAPSVPGAPTVDPLAPVVPSAIDPGIPAPPSATAVTRDAVVAAGERVRIETPSLVGSINLTGGRIDDLLLADYHVTVDPSSPLVELFSPIGTEQPYFAEVRLRAGRRPATGQVPAGVAVPTSQTVWQAEGGPLAPGKRRHAHLGQRRRPRLPPRLSRSTRITSSRSARASRTPAPRRWRSSPMALSAAPACRHRRLLHPA